MPFRNYEHFANGYFPDPSNRDIITKTLRDHFLATLDFTTPSNSPFAPSRAFPILTCCKPIFYGKSPVLLSKTDDVDEKEARLILTLCPTATFTSSLNLSLRGPQFLTEVLIPALEQAFSVDDGPSSSSSDKGDGKEKEKQQPSTRCFEPNKYITRLELNFSRLSQRDKRPAAECYKPFARIFELLGKSLSSVTICGGVVLGPGPAFFDALNENCPFLVRFESLCTRSGLDTDSLANFVEKQKRTLRHFNMNSTAMGVQNLDVVPALKIFTQNVGSRLTELNFSGCTITKEILDTLVEHHCTDFLQTLDFSANQQPLPYKEFFSHCRNLVKVDMSSTLAEDDSYLELIKNNSRTLKYLSMQCNSAGLTPGTILKAIAEQCGNQFESIYLFDSMEAVNDEGVIALVKSCKNLKDLNVMFGDISESALDAIAEHGKNLRLLNILALPKVPSPKTIEKILKGCPKLICLSLSEDILDGRGGKRQDDILKGWEKNYPHVEFDFDG